jgi:hypothetical protein
MTRRQLLIGLATVPACWAFRRVLRNEFVLANESEQVVHDLTVEVSGVEFRFAHLRPDEVVSDRFRAPDDEDAFAVCGRFDDGRAFAGTTGYVAREDADRTFYMAVLPDGVTTRRVA